MDLSPIGDLAIEKLKDYNRQRRKKKIMKWSKFWQLWEFDTALDGLPYENNLLDYLNFWAYDDKGVIWISELQKLSPK